MDWYLVVYCLPGPSPGVDSEFTQDSETHNFDGQSITCVNNMLCGVFSAQFKREHTLEILEVRVEGQGECQLLVCWSVCNVRGLPGFIIK